MRGIVEAWWRRQALPASLWLRAALIVAAGIGAVLLFTSAVVSWGAVGDEGAYWQAGHRLVAGQALYDATAHPGTPYAYFYPPPLAQLVAPLTLVLSEQAFSIAWTGLLVVCLLYLSGWRPVVALAMGAFAPVAVELGYRNIHLVLAALVVLAIRGRPWLFAVGAAAKVAPGLGVLYYALRGEWRAAAQAVAVGVVILAASVALGPDLWAQFLSTVASTAATQGASIVPIPYPVRLVAAVGLTVVAARLPRREGACLLVVAIVLANPTFWATALSLLVAIVPLASGERTTRESVG